MNINGIGAGYPAWREIGKTRRSHAGTGFAGLMAAVKPAYDTYESKNYRIVPDNEAGCFDIYNVQGERLGAFEYSDIKVRQDMTGRQFLISEHGTMSYDALVMDGELKEALQNVMGIETLETEKLQGFTLKTHSGTGIQYLMRDGEEGRGGKVLLQSQEDIEKYEALAETYFNKYPNLIHDKNAAYIWADLEIRGLAQHTDNGIVSMGFNGMSYHDNSRDRNNWSVLFSEDTYQVVFDWLENNRGSIEEMQKFSTWQDVFKNIGSRYERIWSDEEEKFNQRGEGKDGYSWNGSSRLSPGYDTEAVWQGQCFRGVRQTFR